MDNEIKILIIEDEEIVKETLAENLKEKGFAVDTAENAAVAISMISHNRYDILLVDYRLPDMDGLALIKEASALSKDSTAIVVTGYSAVETAVDSMRMGAYDYLLKPIDIDSLVAEIQTIMKERKELNAGKEKVKSGIASSIASTEDDIVVLASRDSLIPVGREGFLRKIVLAPWLLFRKVIEFYWG